MRVCRNGSYCYRGETYFLSTSLAGLVIGLEPVDPFHMRAWLHDVDLGIVDVIPTHNGAVYYLQTTEGESAA